MRSLFTVALPILLVGISAFSATAAAEWRVDPAESALTFSYEESGAPAAGTFRRFAAKASFDAAQPTEARLVLEIDVKSIDLSDDFRSTFVQAEEWFDTRHHPSARFELTKLTPVTEARYIAEGTLTIKGRSVTLSTPFDLKISDTAARAQGTLTFDRGDFEIGGGPGELFLSIGDQIAVSFDLSATPAQ